MNSCPVTVARGTSGRRVLRTTARSDSRSSTCRSDSGNRTYIITASRMISGELLKYRKGFCIPAAHDHLARMRFTHTTHHPNFSSAGGFSGACCGSVQRLRPKFDVAVRQSPRHNPTSPLPPETPIGPRIQPSPTSTVLWPSGGQQAAAGEWPVHRRPRFCRRASRRRRSLHPTFGRFAPAGHDGGAAR